MMSNPSALSQEWTTLQNNFEQYEWIGLAVKLFGVALALLGMVLQLSPIVLGAMLLLVWLQEGILRTFQNRLGQRLLHLEALLRDNSTGYVQQGSTPTDGVHILPFQLHSQWQATRPGGLKLLGEYAAGALRPTVAFPHAVLVIGILLMAVF